MSERRIESLVDALANLKGSSTTPDGELYQIKNPTGIQSFSRPGKNEIDEKGRRIFKSWLAGYRAACFDAQLKCSGESRAGIKATDKLENFLRVMGVEQKPSQQKVVNFLRRALKDQSITTDTPLAWFVEEEK